MPRDAIPINTLLWRTFTPAILILAIALGALVYNRLYATILDGFGRKLETTSALTAALIDPADHDGLMAAVGSGADPEILEASAPYLRNVLPMRRIKRELGLTYLYSQVIGGSKDIFYVLDATEGDNHSPIGSEDTMTAETLAGLKTATARGTIYVSPIEFQEQWGLLKTAAAPIRGQDGQITATAGADVNISVIQVASQNALFLSALIGAASLLACALVTLVIVRRVAQPIGRLKADALRIAAGDRDPPMQAPAPREVSRLREALESLTGQLVSQMRAARAETVAHDRARNLGVLETVLADCKSPAVILQDDGTTRMVWIDGRDEGAESLLARRAMRLLAERIAADPDLAADVPVLAEAQGGWLLVFDQAAASVHLIGETGVNLRVGLAETQLTPGQTLLLGHGASLVAVLGDRTISLDWEAGA